MAQVYYSSDAFNLSSSKVSSPLDTNTSFRRRSSRPISWLEKNQTKNKSSRHSYGTHIQQVTYGGHRAIAVASLSMLSSLQKHTHATLPTALLFFDHLLKIFLFSEYLPSVIWHRWLGVRKGIWPVKIEWWGVGVVILQSQSSHAAMPELLPNQQRQNTAKPLMDTTQATNITHNLVRRESWTTRRMLHGGRVAVVIARLTTDYQHLPACSRLNGEREKEISPTCNQSSAPPPTPVTTSKIASRDHKRNRQKSDSARNTQSKKSV